MPLTIQEAIADVAIDKEVDGIMVEAERTQSVRPLMDAIHGRIMGQVKEDVPPVDAEMTASERYQRDVAKRIAKLSPELKLEIGTFYEQHAIPLDAISKEFGLHNSHVGAIARELKLPLRARGNSDAAPGHFDHPKGSSTRVWVPDAVVVLDAETEFNTVAAPTPFEVIEMQAEPEPIEEVAPPLPTETVKALENMVKLPARPEPRAKPAARGPRFEVTVHGTFTVSAPTIMAAMQDLIKQYPDLRITAIKEV